MNNYEVYCKKAGVIVGLLLTVCVAVIMAAIKAFSKNVDACSQQLKDVDAAAQKENLTKDNKAE